jgi:hypothetical protein
MSENGSPTVAAKLRARGSEIELGGAQARLRLTWDAIEAIEAEWGSMRAWAGHLRNSDGQIFRAIASGIRACIVDYPFPKDTITEMLEPARLTEYAEALTAALAESGLWNEDEGAEGNPEAAETPRSRGGRSTTFTSSPGVSTPSGSGT